MATDKRTSYLRGYKQLNVFIPFLSTFFVTTPRDIRRAKSVKIDIKRGTSKIAPAISAVNGIGGKISKSKYTNKEFTPPTVALGTDFEPSDLENKAFSMTEYESADMEYQEQLQSEISDSMMEIDTQLQRNPEYQCAKVLQYGEVTLYDDKGEIAFEINYAPKATHFPTVTTAWSDPSGDKDADLIALYETIKKDGKVNADNIIFSRESLTQYLVGTSIEKKFDNRRYDAGVVSPVEVNADVNFLGELLIGYKRFKCWLYEGEYEDPSSASDDEFPFVEANKVIMIPSAGSPNLDLRKVWCVAPTITGVDPRFAGLVPSNMMLTDRQYTNRVWVEGSSDTLNVELKARPLCIPVSIDAFGCLTTAL